MATSIPSPAKKAPPRPLPDDLIWALARRECVVVVGAGVSAGCLDEKGKPPSTWKELLEKASSKLDTEKGAVVAKLIAERDYLTAAEVLFAELGDRKMHKVLEEEFLKRKFTPTETHVRIGQLGQRVYVTPNYDTIFDNYARQEFDQGVSVKIQSQTDILPWLRGGDILVIKNHGTIDSTASIVLTRSQYARERVSNSSFFRILDSLFITKTVLFIGCGLSDPDFQLMMEDGALAFPGAPPHYMIKLWNEQEELIDGAHQKLRNLEMIYYENSHSELPGLLDELILAVESKRALVR